jgi:hypothetical protein
MIHQSHTEAHRRAGSIAKVETAGRFTGHATRHGLRLWAPLPVWVPLRPDRLSRVLAPPHFSIETFFFRAGLGQ